MILFSWIDLKRGSAQVVPCLVFPQNRHVWRVPQTTKKQMNKKRLKGKRKNKTVWCTTGTIKPRNNHHPLLSSAPGKNKSFFLRSISASYHLPKINSSFLSPFFYYLSFFALCVAQRKKRRNEPRCTGGSASSADGCCAEGFRTADVCWMLSINKGRDAPFHREDFGHPYFS